MQRPGTRTLPYESARICGRISSIGPARSYRLREWDQLYATEGAEWVAVPLDEATHGSEASRLQLFAAAVRGVPSPHLADFATALRVQEVVEAFHS